MKTDASKVRSPHQIRVRSFLRQAGHETPDSPVMMENNDLRLLYARLITEEYLETMDELGMGIYARGPGQLELHALEFVDSKLVNLPDLAKELADLSVTTIGTMAAFGISDEAILRAVDDNNLEKFGPGGHRDPCTQKWVKPPGHPKPDIAAVLRAQGWQPTAELNGYEKSSLS